MTSANSLCKNQLNVKSTVITDTEIFIDEDGIKHLLIHARPNKWYEDYCPVCHARCPKYDTQLYKPKIWRSLDFGSIIVEIKYCTYRINCLKHGILVSDVPWAYPNSKFTKAFDLTVGWLAVYLPKSAVSEYMRIDWATVGRCVSRTLNVIEPEFALFYVFHFLIENLK